MSKTTILLIFLYLNCKLSLAQICITNENVPNFLQSQPQPYNIINGNITIRIAVHIMKDDNCQQGISDAEMYTALQILENDLKSHNICISLNKIYRHCDSQLSLPHGGGSGLLNTASSNDAIDIYFLPSSNTLAAGYSPDIPGFKLLISGTNTPADGGMPLFLTHALSHEFGHCLGLFHTFHGSNTFCFTGYSCPELVNGNCSVSCSSSVCGDYISDTPADPCMTPGDVNPVNCNFLLNRTDENNDIYTPDRRNIMSYSHPDCQQYFSVEQGNKMRTILSNPIFTQRIVPDNIFIQNISTGTFVRIYAAPTSLTAGNNVTAGPIGNVEFGNTSNIQFQAGGYIDIKSGFTSDPDHVSGPFGGLFNAEINSNMCGYTQGINSARIANTKYYSLTPSAWLYSANTVDGYISEYAVTGGDTVINGKSYTSIKITYVDLPGIFNNPWFSGTYFKYIRYDSLADKVYKFETGQDRLLYDYTLNLGDTLVQDFILTTIDTFTVSLGVKKRYIFQNTFGLQIIWLKGIGNISDPFSPETLLYPNAALICYHEQGLLIYENLIFPGMQCLSYNEISKVDFKRNLLIFPNPVTFELKISFPENDKAEKEVSIYDLTGRLVIFKKSDNEDININTESILNGAYIVVVKKGGRTYTNKFIKSE
jgi:hypothetical protein